MFFNALPTSRRIRHFAQTLDIRSITYCPFCGDHQKDDVFHFFKDCPRIRDSFESFCLNIDLKIDKRAMKLLPQASELDIHLLHFEGHKREKEIMAICIFNYSVWYSRKYFISLHTPGPAPATINRITRTALLDYLKYANQPQPRKGGYGSASSRTAECIE